MASTAQLILRVGDREVRTILLTKSPFRIGRNPDNTLPLQHPLVSREHAELRQESQGWTLTDLRSANGTLLDDARMLPDQPRLLQPGASIKIGPFELVFQAEAAPQAETQAPSDASDVQPVVHTPQLADNTLASTPAAPTNGEEQASQLVPTPVADGEEQAPPPDTSAPPDVPPPPEDEPAAMLVRLMQPPIALAMQTLLPTQHAPSRYLGYLPIIFHDTDFLRRYLLIFESIWEPLENRETHIDMYVDPRTAPVPFLAWLASWLGLALNTHWPEVRQRQLLSEAMNLYRWRGTNYGLARMIEVCTGLVPEISDGPPLDPFIFRVRLSIPKGSDVDPAFVEDLIRTHKPAHAGYILEIRS